MEDLVVSFALHFHSASKKKKKEEKGEYDRWILSNIKSYLYSTFLSLAERTLRCKNFHGESRIGSNYEVAPIYELRSVSGCIRYF